MIYDDCFRGKIFYSEISSVRLLDSQQPLPPQARQDDRSGEEVHERRDRRGIR